MKRIAVNRHDMITLMKSYLNLRIYMIYGTLDSGQQPDPCFFHISLF